MNKINVTDGKIIFKDYYFVDGEIISEGKHQPYFYYNNQGLYHVILYDNNGVRVDRSVQKLKKFTIPNAKLRQLLKKVKNFVPVFGHQTEYCFNPNNPFEVFSYRLRRMLNIIKTQKYFQVGIKGENGCNLYIHKMVAEYHSQKFINTRLFEIHHLSHNPAECNIENLLILPVAIHKAFEMYYKRMNKGKITKEALIKKINKFKLDEQKKKKLIESLDAQTKEVC